MPPASLTPETPIRMPVSRFWAILVSCVSVTGGGAIYGTGLLRDIRDEMKSLNAAVSSSWSVSDQERWAHRLYRDNRGIPLSVPDVNEVRGK